MTTILRWVDVAAFAVGVIIGVAWILRQIRRGTWRDPLAPVPRPGGPARATDVFLVLFGFFAAAIAMVAVLQATGADADNLQPGDHRWHLFHFQDWAGKLTAFAVGAWLIWKHRDAAADSTSGVSLVASAAGAAGVTIALLPIVGLQLLGIQILWRHLWPDVPPPSHDLLLALHNSDWGWWGQLQITISALLIAPLGEEVFFRGILLPVIQRGTNAHWPAVVASGVAFGIVHFSAPQSVVPLITMGIGLGWLRVWSGRLWPCVLAHALFNGRTMLLAFLAPELLDSR